MINDFAEFDDGATVAADICIVGGGAAGITLSREFIGTHFSVLMLEGRPRRRSGNSEIVRQRGGRTASHWCLSEAVRYFLRARARIQT